MNTIEFSREALEELDSVADWYDAQTRGAGQHLYDEVMAKAEVIRQSPEQGAIYPRTRFRFRKLDTFPYLIVYQQQGTILRIVAIAHGSRRPGYWKGR